MRLRTQDWKLAKETDKGQLEKKKENKYGVMETKSRKCFKRRK